MDNPANNTAVPINKERIFSTYTTINHKLVITMAILDKPIPYMVFLCPHIFFEKQINLRKSFH